MSPRRQVPHDEEGLSASAGGAVRSFGVTMTNKELIFGPLFMSFQPNATMTIF